MAAHLDPALSVATLSADTLADVVLVRFGCLAGKRLLLATPLQYGQPGSSAFRPMRGPRAELPPSSYLEGRTGAEVVWARAASRPGEVSRG